MSSFENVDFPADFGPQMSVVGGSRPSADSVRAASFLFHWGGDTSSWMMHLLGASSEVPS